METYKLGGMEQKFADMIWEREPIPSGELVKHCQAAFQWKKSTTYTMLKRLCERGIFENRDGLVTARIKKPDFHAIQGEAFLEEAFDGSLPRFLTAFTRRRPLSAKELSALQRLIDEYQEG